MTEPAIGSTAYIETWADRRSPNTHNRHKPFRELSPQSQNNRRILLNEIEWYWGVDRARNWFPIQHRPEDLPEDPLDWCDSYLQNFKDLASITADNISLANKHMQDVARAERSLGEWKLCATDIRLAVDRRNMEIGAEQEKLKGAKTQLNHGLGGESSKKRQRDQLDESEDDDRDSKRGRVHGDTNFNDFSDHSNGQIAAGNTLHEEHSEPDHESADGEIPRPDLATGFAADPSTGLPESPVRNANAYTDLGDLPHAPPSPSPSPGNTVLVPLTHFDQTAALQPQSSMTDEQPNDQLALVPYSGPATDHASTGATLPSHGNIGAVPPGPNQNGSFINDALQLQGGRNPNRIQLIRVGFDHMGRPLYQEIVMNFNEEL